MNYEEFYKQFNISLNEQQAQAVLHTQSAVLLLAVPGSSNRAGGAAGIYAVLRGRDPGEHRKQGIT